MISASMRKNTAKDVVVESIQQYIINKKLNVGDRLPTECEMAKQLGISRGVVRTGLQHFKTLGILDSKSKTGAYVKRMIPENPFEGYIPYLKLRSKTVTEIGVMRFVMEGGLIPIWIKKTTESDLKRLTELAERFKEVDSYIADRDFHCFLLKMSGNEIFNSLTPLIKAFFQENTEQDHKEVSGAIQCEWHMRYVNGIREKNVDALRKEIESHYQAYLSA